MAGPVEGWGDGGGWGRVQVWKEGESGATKRGGVGARQVRRGESKR